MPWHGAAAVAVVLGVRCWSPSGAGAGCPGGVCFPSRQKTPVPPLRDAVGSRLSAPRPSSSPAQPGCEGRARCRPLGWGYCRD